MIKKAIVAGLICTFTMGTMVFAEDAKTNVAPEASFYSVSDTSAGANARMIEPRSVESQVILNESGEVVGETRGVPAAPVEGNANDGIMLINEDGVAPISTNEIEPREGEVATTSETAPEAKVTTETSETSDVNLFVAIGAFLAGGLVTFGGTKLFGKKSVKA